MALFDLPPHELERYRPVVPEPADFDAFWAGSLAGEPSLVDVRPEPAENAFGAGCSMRRLAGRHGRRCG